MAYGRPVGLASEKLPLDRLKALALSFGFD